MNQTLEEAQLRAYGQSERKRFLITFSGIDGSGKSSQVVSLQSTLSLRSLPVVRAWAGNKPILSYPFLALIRLLGLTRRKKIQGLIFVRRDIRRNRAIAYLWPLILALDFVPKALVSVAVPLHRGKIVICDRYVYDFIAELNEDDLLGAKGKMILMNLLPKPDLAFLMDVDTELAWKRALTPGRAREQPIYDLAGRRGAYLQLSKEVGMIVVNGARDADQNRALILKETLDRLRVSKIVLN